MSSLCPDGIRSLDAVRSRLGRSLLQLHQNIERSRAGEVNDSTLYTNWQRRWSTRREQIARRLEMIESQLAELAQETVTPPRLAVVGVPNDSESMGAIGSF